MGFSCLPVDLPTLPIFSPVLGAAYIKAWTGERIGRRVIEDCRSTALNGTHVWCCKNEQTKKARWAFLRIIKECGQ